MKRIVLLCAGLAALPVQAEALYRWVDAQGKVHYGDVIPLDAARVETKKFPDAATPVDDLPYEARRAQQNFPVTLYVADNCIEPCNQARSLLSKRGIPFSEKILRTKDEIDAFKARYNFDTAPALLVGKTMLKDFLAEQWNNELNIAGYPRSAPYRAPKARVPPAAAPAAASQVAPPNP